MKKRKKIEQHTLATVFFFFKQYNDTLQYFVVKMYERARTLLKKKKKKKTYQPPCPTPEHFPFRRTDLNITQNVSYEIASLINYYNKL